MIDAHEDDINAKELADFALGMNRVVSCVNSLSGVPDSWLADRAAAKALLAWKLVEWTIEEDLYEPFTSMQEPIDIAIDFRKHGYDFGELNTLIDSFA